MIEGKELGPESHIIIKWVSPQGIEFFRKIEIDRDYLITVEQKVTNVSNKDILIKLDFRPLKLKIENNSYYNDNEIDGQLSFDLINKDKLVNYSLNNNVLSFNTKNQKFTGEINIKPFFLSSNLILN